MFKEDIYIVSGCRTPIGSFKQTLASVSAPILGATCIKETLRRANSNDIDIDEVIMGQVNQSNCGQAPARQASILAGIEKSVPCSTINKVCASGMKSIIIGCQSICCGINNVVIAGGQESMSNVPYYMPRKDPSYGGFQMVDGIVKDCLTDAYNQCQMGVCAEKVAEQLGISRHEQDEYARLSYERSRKAADGGVFDKEIVPITVTGPKGVSVIVDEDDEWKRADFSKMPLLRPAFKDNGTITAANASSLGDGAATVMLMSLSAMQKYGVRPLAKVLGYADAAIEPIDFVMAPAASINKLLLLSGLAVDDIDLWEINEAFSVVVPTTLRLVPGIDGDKVNIHGGAVSLGHPVGMSGARIVLHLAMTLKSGEKGIASICIGGGEGCSVLLEGL